MIIETWILVMVLLFLGGGSIISQLGWMACEGKKDELQDELEKQKENVRELKWQLTNLRAKNNVKVANDYFESGNK